MFNIILTPVEILLITGLPIIYGFYRLYINLVQKYNEMKGLFINFIDEIRQMNNKLENINYQFQSFQSKTDPILQTFKFDKMMQYFEKLAPLYINLITTFMPSIKSMFGTKKSEYVQTFPSYPTTVPIYNDNMYGSVPNNYEPHNDYESSFDLGPVPAPCAHNKFPCSLHKVVKVTATETTGNEIVHNTAETYNAIKNAVENALESKQNNEITIDL